VKRGAKDGSILPSDFCHFFKLIFLLIPILGKGIARLGEIEGGWRMGYGADPDWHL
jgi:hypothetical protein